MASMSPFCSLPPLRPELEEIVTRFEGAWHTGAPPNIAAFVAEPTARLPLNEIDRRRLLFELVAIDLEFRWKRNTTALAPEPTHELPARPTAADYLAQFPELGKSESDRVRLLAEEYRARRLWSGPYSPTTFVLQHGSAASPELISVLSHIDDEVNSDNASAAWTRRRPTRLRKTRATDESHVDPRAPLPYSDFLLQRQIGAGGMGKVYASRQRSLDRPVAVKFLRRSLLEHPEAVERFISEARTIARLKHPHIVGVHGLGRTPGGGYFIVMDLIEGSDLGRRLKQAEVSIESSLKWVAEVADAVAAAHEQSIVHCDLKPSNILIDSHGSAWVTDFGLARCLDNTPTLPGGLEGTAPWMAPEQIDESFGSVSERTDVFGLGGLLYSTLTGQTPRPGKHPADFMAATVSGVPIVPITEHRADAPDCIAAVVARSLSTHPKDRFRSASEFAESLRAIQA